MSQNEPDFTRSPAGTRQPGQGAADGRDRDPDFVAALARGLDVLTCFTSEHRRMTLSQVAERTRLTRGTARRFLITLETLGYMGSDGKYFWLAPKVLSLGTAYLDSFGVSDAVRRVLQRVAETIDEASSMAVLQGPQVIYVARVDAPREFTSSLKVRVGAQLPAHCSSLGRVMLAQLDDAALEAWLLRNPLDPVTHRTITDPAALRAVLQDVRRQGYAIVNGEMEIGRRSLAVPVMGSSKLVIGAINTSTLAARTSLDRLRRVFLPVLRRAAEEIGHTFSLR